jgi:hypothetical protein
LINVLYSKVEYYDGLIKSWHLHVVYPGRVFIDIKTARILALIKKAWILARILVNIDSEDPRVERESMDPREDPHVNIDSKDPCVEK